MANVRKLEVAGSYFEAVDFIVCEYCYVSHSVETAKLYGLLSDFLKQA